jgi:endoglucanase
MKTSVALLLAFACPALLPVAATVVDRVTPPFDLGPGINFGNYLEAPHEGAWTEGRVLQDQDFATVRKAGFDTVRVPIRWAAHLVPNDPNFTIDPAFFARIDWVVAEAKKYGLSAILDYHHDNALMNDPDGQAARFLAIWGQIEEHYKSEPPNILFELLNEPHGNLDAARWNNLAAEALAAVRADNPTRVVIIGPARWNAPGALGDLLLPASDRNIIVTIHYYGPMQFTHQGAGWINGAQNWKNVTWNGTAAEGRPIWGEFDYAAQWGLDHQRAIFVGEFGSISNGPMDSRARWTKFIVNASRVHGFSWAYWEFSSGFGAYDPAARQWRGPLLEALLPDHAGN